MNRILSEQNVGISLTVNDILGAYSRSELKPIVGEYLIQKDGKCYGCVLSALWLDTIDLSIDDSYLGMTQEDKDCFVESAIDSANKRFGPNNILALLLGFDNKEPKGPYFTWSETEYYEVGRLASQQLGLHKGNLV